MKKSSFKYKKHSLIPFILPKTVSMAFELNVGRTFLSGKISLWKTKWIFILSDSFVFSLYINSYSPFEFFL